ncbi:MAG TPA: MerR family transcriptional regulator [Anaerolineae bacterium]|nr:MerR family transcriptional regulator [Anaerolineae bacterium]
MNVTRSDAYTVRQLAKLAGVTVRTLHHYDQIGILRPSARTAAGYRLYGEADLLRLQQIMLYKELDIPLDQIREILDDPRFDPVQALRSHRQTLQARAARLETLLHTVDKTIAKLTEDTTMMTDEELYAGFTKEQAERYRREAREMWDPDFVEATEQRVRKMSKAQWAAVGQQGEEATQLVASLMGRSPDDPAVQAAIAQHHAWIENFYPAPAELYRGLGQMYVEHPEFRAFYEKYRPGLADFMQAAMAHYADTALTN